jgi:hypothetical protein
MNEADELQRLRGLVAKVFGHLPNDGHEWETRLRVKTDGKGGIEIVTVKHLAIMDDGEVFSFPPGTRQ